MRDMEADCNLSPVDLMIFRAKASLGNFPAAFRQDHVGLGQGQRAAARRDEDGLSGHALAWFIPERGAASMRDPAFWRMMAAQRAISSWRWRR